jgi:hypothetical protein
MLLKVVKNVGFAHAFIYPLLGTCFWPVARWRLSFSDELPSIGIVLEDALRLLCCVWPAPPPGGESHSIGALQPRTLQLSFGFYTIVTGETRH